MTAQWLKPAGFGILAGALLFAIPFFIFKVLVFFLLLGLVRRLWWGPSWGYRHGYARHGRYGMWHKLQQMSDEERNAFFARTRESGCGPRVPVPPSEDTAPTDTRILFNM